MVLFNNLVCLVRGHARTWVTSKGSSYQYCLNCGRIEATGDNPDHVTLPEWKAQKDALSILPQVRQY